MNAPPAPDLILRDYLASLDVSCPGCRYNLRGITTGVCPECNRVLHLQLAAPDQLAHARPIGWVALGIMFLTSATSLLLWWFVFTDVFVPGEPLVVLFHIAVITAIIAWLIVRGVGRWSNTHPFRASPVVAASVGLVVTCLFNVVIGFLRGSLF